MCPFDDHMNKCLRVSGFHHNLISLNHSDEYHDLLVEQRQCALEHMVAGGGVKRNLHWVR